MKALGCQPVESTSPFKVLVSDVNLHPYSAGSRPGSATSRDGLGGGRQRVGSRPGSARRLEKRDSRGGGGSAGPSPYASADEEELEQELSRVGPDGFYTIHVV